jgi:hypothetical protein
MLPEQTISLGSLFVFETFVDVVYLSLGYIVNVDSALEVIFKNYCLARIALTT